MRNLVVATAMIVLGAAGLVRAQPAPEHEVDPLERHLFPPELVMENQSRLGLDEAQARAIKEAVKEVLPQTLELEWDLQDQALKLEKLVEAPAPDEAAVLAQADRVMDLERKVKRAHLTLLVRIKRALTPDQHRQLREIRREYPPH